MTNIWRVLVDEPRKAVDQHFDAILQELLREMGGKLWRNRESAALAIADLLQVRGLCLPAARVQCCFSANLHGTARCSGWAGSGGLQCTCIAPRPMQCALVGKYARMNKGCGFVSTYETLRQAVCS